MDLVFLLPRPKSLPKKIIHHTKKPDLDNLTKSIKDALEGIFFKNDSQITELKSLKMYVPDSMETGVKIALDYDGDIQIKKGKPCKK